MNPLLQISKISPFSHHARCVYTKANRQVVHGRLYKKEDFSHCHPILNNPPSCTTQVYFKDHNFLIEQSEYNKKFSYNIKRKDLDFFKSGKKTYELKSTYVFFEHIRITFLKNITAPASLIEDTIAKDKKNIELEALDRVALLVGLEKRSDLSDLSKEAKEELKTSCELLWKSIDTEI